MFRRIMLLAVLFCTCAVAQEESPADLSEITLPYQIDDQDIKPLRSLVDPELNRQLTAALNANREWAKLIRKKKMAVGLVDLSNPRAAKFARVNGQHMMYAASLPKLAILLAAVQGLEDGSLTETPDVLNDMQIMINKSDNGAATRMIDRITLQKIADVLTDERYELYDPDNGGGLWCGKRYAKTGKRFPDPFMGISHGASVTQVCRFYYLAALGKLVNFERSKQLLEILEDPKIHHKFVHSLDRLAPMATVYRKSGTWRQYHADSALVWGPVWRRYIIVALVDDARGEQILRNLIPTVEELLNPTISEPGEL